MFDASGGSPRAKGKRGTCIPLGTPSKGGFKRVLSFFVFRRRRLVIVRSAQLSFSFSLFPFFFLLFTFYFLSFSLLFSRKVCNKLITGALQALSTFYYLAR